MAGSAQEDTARRVPGQPPELRDKRFTLRVTLFAPDRSLCRPHGTLATKSPGTLGILL